MSKVKMGAPRVLQVLRDGPFRVPAHAWLYEVRNQTGYNRQERYADALVVSLWPSRGIWIGGIEVKVSRSDWRKELDDPTKSSEIQRFCDRWWVAAPAGVVEEAEVPENWGYFLIDGKKAKEIKKAPELTPEPLTKGFVASVLRNEAKALEVARNQGREEGRESVVKQNGGEDLSEQLQKAKTDLWNVKRQLEWKERDYDRLLESVQKFEQAAGLEEPITSHRYGNGTQSIGETYRLAMFLRDQPLAALAGQFEKIASELRHADESTREKGAAE